jgi:hypothetical protein
MKAELKMELLKLVNQTGIRVVLAKDLENQIKDLKELIHQLRKELKANQSGIDRMPQGDAVRVAVLQKIQAINKFRFVQ